ncbi:MAG: insulinase family protein [Clostridia bacterium]|nr:insulinase family protein [Clostridia bacterium]
MTSVWSECSSELLRERYFYTLHPSGLPIYVFPKKLTTTYALFATKYGSVDNDFRLEGDPQTVSVPDGIAHFLEHKLFDNEDGSDSFSRFSEYGADANAYTSYNRTAYLFSCTERFEDSLTELLRFVTHPHFTEASVKKEQGIIAEEIRMYEDNPWSRCYRGLLEILYEKNPVRKNICGSEESIRQITPRLLYDCYRVFYNPSNMALVVCGDVTPEAVERVADRELPATANPVRICRVQPEEAPGVVSPRRYDRMEVSKPLFSIGIKDLVIPVSPAERLRRDAAMTLLNEVLFSRSGEFYNRLFEEGLLTPSFEVGYSGTETFAFNSLSGESDRPEEIFSRLQAYLKQTRERGLDREEVERCRRVLYADEIRAYDSTDEIANRLLSFIFDESEMFSYPALLQEITVEELEALLRDAFCEELTAMSVVEPLEGDPQDVDTCMEVMK